MRKALVVGWWREVVGELELGVGCFGQGTAPHIQISYLQLLGGSLVVITSLKQCTCA